MKNLLLKSYPVIYYESREHSSSSWSMLSPSSTPNPHYKVLILPQKADGKR